MKPSKYNYIIKDSDNDIFYNGITDNGFRVSKENSEKFARIIDNPDVNYDSFKPFIDRMMQTG